MRFPQSSTSGSPRHLLVPPVKILRQIHASGRLGGKSICVTLTSLSSVMPKESRPAVARSVRAVRVLLMHRPEAKGSRDLFSSISSVSSQIRRSSASHPNRSSRESLAAASPAKCYALPERPVTGTTCPACRSIELSGLVSRVPRSSGPLRARVRSRKFSRATACFPRVPTPGNLPIKVVQQVTKTRSHSHDENHGRWRRDRVHIGPPFWVVGKRWMMAKHLQEGSICLHSVSGPLPIENIEEIPAATAWYDVLVQSCKSMIFTRSSWGEPGTCPSSFHALHFG